MHERVMVKIYHPPCAIAGHITGSVQKSVSPPRLLAICTGPGTILMVFSMNDDMVSQ
jgi:hypothetical protein